MFAGALEDDEAEEVAAIVCPVQHYTIYRPAFSKCPSCPGPRWIAHGGYGTSPWSDNGFFLTMRVNEHVFPIPRCLLNVRSDALRFKDRVFSLTLDVL
jgi:hypothetical protein